MVCSKTENLCVIQGDLYTRVVEYVNPDGSPVPLTGYTSRLAVKDRVDDALPIFELTDADGLTVEDGMITIIITAERTALLSWTGAVYDLELTPSGGSPETILAGRVEVQDDVT